MIYAGRYGIDHCKGMVDFPGVDCATGDASTANMNLIIDVGLPYIADKSLSNGIQSNNTCDDIVARIDDLYKLPDNLPVPVDDGACDHLPGLRLAPIALPSTGGGVVDLSKREGTVVVYCYPRTGRPDKAPTPGWNDIPGARGCTPQSCAFRDHYQELRGLNVAVYGLSTQTTDDQKEMVARLHLPFDVLSDADLQFTRALNLPTFAVESMTLIKRLTLITRDGVVQKVFYPVFPPDKNPDEVIVWLSQCLPNS